ncbi:MAG: M1 family metallopeptidase, partial [Pyrinomonadaceae bacterium]
WLKEGFAEFMAYKTLEKVMPEVNAWKVFYERNKQAAYLTDSTKGTTAIYQPIANLNSAKSAYGNIVYRKAPSFLKQAEFYIGPDKFQTAVRSLLKKHDFANAGWEDLVREFENASGQQLADWGESWVKQRGLPIVRVSPKVFERKTRFLSGANREYYETFGNLKESSSPENDLTWRQRVSVLMRFDSEATQEGYNELGVGAPPDIRGATICSDCIPGDPGPKLGRPLFAFPNYRDHGYGIFLLDNKSRDYVLKNIQNEKDDFLRTMMWGSLWDSVREAELDPKEYVELVVKNIKFETDESTIQTLLGRVSTAMRYYIGEKGGNPSGSEGALRGKVANLGTLPTGRVSASLSTLPARIEAVLIDKMQNASTPGQQITYYRAFLNMGSTPNARRIMKKILAGVNDLERLAATAKSVPVRSSAGPQMTMRTKDRFDIVSRLVALGDPEALKLLADLEKTETSDEAKRYAYAARAGFATADNKAKYWNDFVNNKNISESWIEAAFGPFNSTRQSDLTLPYLEKALAKLPDLKQNRKIFFVNGWLGAFIGGQKSEAALAVVNKFLADNPNLDNDLRLKILENVDLIERAVKIRSRYGADKAR